jgi:hypothetical protein
VETHFEEASVNDPVELWNFYTSLFETLGDVSFGAVVFDFDLDKLDPSPNNVPYAGE